MSSIAMFSYVCSTCGGLHEGAPSFAYRAPDPFSGLPAQAKSDAYLDSDLCRYTDEDGDHYFVRGCLEIPIVGYGQPFLWGVWASLSKASFERYIDTYEDPDPDDCYFGWLCNCLPYYRDTYAMKLDVRPRSEGVRPLFEPHECDHSLAIDYHRGLTFDRAKEIAEHVLHAE